VKLSAGMAWAVLFVAGLLEVAWAVGLKYSEGFSKALPSAVTLVLAWLSFFLLGWAVKVLPIGTAYGVWTGIGAIGTALCGVWLFGEAATAGRLACIVLIVAGIIGLKFLS
jgi:quaternary ammonium compound-resistance protein SugE